MTAEWSKCVSTACLVEPCIGLFEKCLAESPLVRHVWGRPLVCFCKFWDTIKCHRMHRVTAEWSECVSSAYLVKPCPGRVGVVRKMFS